MHQAISCARKPWLRTPGTWQGGIGAECIRLNLGSPRRTNTGPSGLFGPGRYAFNAVIAFFLDRFRNVPNRVVGFGADFVSHQSGLVMALPSGGNRINFAQFAVIV